MPKNALILHGSGGTSNSFWLPWLAQNLTQNGFQVHIPTLPHDNDLPNINTWLTDLKSLNLPNTFDLIVTHSAGGPLALRLLETHKTHSLIMVAGYLTTLPNLEQEGLTFNINAIQKNSVNRIYIHSNNDPWGCLADTQGAYLQNTLGGRLIIMDTEGHFGSDTYTQPYKYFPLLLSLALGETQ